MSIVQAIVVISVILLHQKCTAFVPVSCPVSYTRSTRTRSFVKSLKCRADLNGCDGFRYGNLGRKDFITAFVRIGGTLATIYTPLISNAVEPNDVLGERILLKGTVKLKNGDEMLPEERSSSALYITARPQKVDNIPRAILDGSNGKPPPVLASRIPNPVFPYDFTLSTLDLTPEGAFGLDVSRGKYWFEGENMVVSARWDTDGIASTRDPTDLVGRSQYFASAKDDGETMVTVELVGRGLAGKMVTGKSKKS